MSSKLSLLSKINWILDNTSEQAFRGSDLRGIGQDGTVGWVSNLPLNLKEFQRTQYFCSKLANEKNVKFWSLQCTLGFFFFFLRKNATFLDYIFNNTNFTAFGAENWRDMGIGWDKPVKKLLK